MTARRVSTLLLITVLLSSCGANHREELDAARAAVEESGPKEALDLAQKLAAKRPTDEAVRVELSELLVELMDPGRAVKLLSDPAAESPREKNALAFAQMVTMNLAEGDRILAELVREGKDSARTHLWLGVRLFSTDKVREAEREIRKATEMDPDDPRSFAWLGAVVSAAGRAEEAEEFLRKALVRFPDSPAVRKAMADALLASQGGDPEALRKVVDLLGLVARKRPLDQSARSKLAVAHLRLENFGEAEVELLKMVEEWPKEPLFWSDLGLARLRRGNMEGAVAAFERAFELNPEQPSILLNLANAYLSLADTAEDREAAAKRAREVFQIGLERYPGHPDLMVGVARSMVKENPGADLDPVLPIYQGVLEKHPNHFPANLNLALLLYDRWKASEGTREEDGRRSWEHFRRAAAVEPEEKWDRHAVQVFGELKERFGK